MRCITSCRRSAERISSRREHLQGNWISSSSPFSQIARPDQQPRRAAFLPPRRRRPVAGDPGPNGKAASGVVSAPSPFVKNGRLCAGQTGNQGDQRRATKEAEHLQRDCEAAVLVTKLRQQVYAGDVEE